MENFERLANEAFEKQEWTLASENYFKVAEYYLTELAYQSDPSEMKRLRNLHSKYTKLAKECQKRPSNFGVSRSFKPVQGSVVSNREEMFNTQTSNVSNQHQPTNTFDSMNLSQPYFKRVQSVYRPISSLSSTMLMNQSIAPIKPSSHSLTIQLDQTEIQDPYSNSLLDKSYYFPREESLPFPNETASQDDPFTPFWSAIDTIMKQFSLTQNKDPENNNETSNIENSYYIIQPSQMYNHEPIKEHPSFNHETSQETESQINTLIKENQILLQTINDLSRKLYASERAIEENNLLKSSIFQFKNQMKRGMGQRHSNSPIYNSPPNPFKPCEKSSMTDDVIISYPVKKELEYIEKENKEGVENSSPPESPPLPPLITQIHPDFALLPGQSCSTSLWFSTSENQDKHQD